MRARYRAAPWHSARSLAGYVKRRMKSAVSFVSKFEESLLRHARDRGMDGVICGHIHVAAMLEREGITYINCGDWVDSCTAVVEHLGRPHGAGALVRADGAATRARAREAGLITRPYCRSYVIVLMVTLPPRGASVAMVS
jgi:hypothetical protein